MDDYQYLLKLTHKIQHPISLVKLPLHSLNFPLLLPQVTSWPIPLFLKVLFIPALSLYLCSSNVESSQVVHLEQVRFLLKFIHSLQDRVQFIFPRHLRPYVSSLHRICLCFEEWIHLKDRWIHLNQHLQFLCLHHHHSVHRVHLQLICSAQVCSVSVIKDTILPWSTSRLPHLKD